MKLTFNDVIIEPTFSNIRSRKNCTTEVVFQGNVFSVPIISSNMDTVTDVKMANALGKINILSSLHRFCTVQENVSMYKACENKKTTYASIGVGATESERFMELYDAGCRNFVIDVAHGASIQVIDMLEFIEQKTGLTTNLIVGNFASGKGVKQFEKIAKERGIRNPFAVKVGVGPGSMCTTRLVTGCGYPQISAIQEIRSELPHRQIIADGGIKSTGDIAKALVAGADLVMIGGMLAGSEETPGDIYSELGFNLSRSDRSYTEEAIAYKNAYKKYRGSASKESYEAQGKVADHRTPEGEATLIPYKGPVANVIQQIQAGLQSAMSYVGCSNISDFKRCAELVQISQAGYREGEAHGK